MTSTLSMSGTFSDLAYCVIQSTMFTLFMPPEETILGLSFVCQFVCIYICLQTNLALNFYLFMVKCFCLVCVFLGCSSFNWHKYWVLCDLDPVTVDNPVRGIEVHKPSLFFRYSFKKVSDISSVLDKKSVKKALNKVDDIPKEENIDTFKPEVGNDGEDKCPQKRVSEDNFSGL